MKKLMVVPVVCLLIGFVQVAAAQVQLAVGLKGGLNFARLDGHSNVTQNYGARTGYHLGAYGMIKIAKWAIQPELLYSKQGQNFDYNKQNLRANFDYVNIPIMIKRYLGVGFNLQAGPQFGFLAGSKGNIINASGPAVTSGDLKQFVKASDISISFGFGWDLPLGISIGARYNRGLTDVNKLTDHSAQNQAQISSMGYEKARNQVIQVFIGYRLLKIGKK